MIGSPRLRQVHLWLAIAWIMPGIPLGYWIVFYLPPQWAAFAILVVSLWANMATHLGAYGSARAEQMADPSQPNPGEE